MMGGEEKGISPTSVASVLSNGKRDVCWLLGTILYITAISNQSGHELSHPEHSDVSKNPILRLCRLRFFGLNMFILTPQLSRIHSHIEYQSCVQIVGSTSLSTPHIHLVLPEIH